MLKVSASSSFLLTSILYNFVNHYLLKIIAVNTKVPFTYWLESDDKYLGYLNDYPDHWTQGNDLSDLKEHLLDLYSLFSKEKIVGIKKVEDLLVA